MRSENLRKPGSAPFFFLILLVCMLIPAAWDAAAQTVENPAIQAYERARESFQNDRLLEAVRYYQDALSMNPRYTQAYRGLAEAFYFLDEQDEAYRYIMQALSRAPRDSANRALQGRILIALGEIREAEEIFRDILSREPYNRDALMGLGEGALNSGRIIQARSFFNSSLEYHPGDHKILISLAYIHVEQGDPDTAEEYISAAIQADSRNHWVQYHAAEFYYMTGDLRRAEAHARLSMDLQEGFPPALELLSRIQLARNDYEAALESIGRMQIEDLRNNSLILYTKALAEYNSGRPEDALRTLAALLREYPEDEAARLLLESIIMFQDSFDSPRRGRFAEYHFTRAGEYIQRNRYDSALYHFQRGLNLAPFSPSGRRAYAEFFKEKGDYQRYLQQLEFLRDQLGITDTAVSDDLEIFQDLLRDSVARNWDIDQFTMQRNTIRLAVFYDPLVRTRHDRLGYLFSRHLMNRLYSSFRVEFIDPGNTGSLEFEPVESRSSSQAFRLAREEDADMYVVLSVFEDDESIHTRATLHLANTGRIVGEFSVLRSGNTRLKDNVLQLNRELLQAIPLEGRLMERQFERGLVNIGAHDGLEGGEEFLILKAGSVEYAPREGSFLYDEDDIAGYGRITRVDFLLSEMEMETEGFFDRINSGDIVIPAPDSDSQEGTEDQETTSQAGRQNDTDTGSNIQSPGGISGLGMSIYQRIRSIR
ncbi:tetratricopeptide repeat protein [Salinispira pacifica]|uniref:Tetratricopeptide repeat protein n=1 Tax=Salinispira pacifica TaxID=1307761 RepID=V5WI66_9SPIO|nr:tetratricopeptide repeat protein [Salinispira pacifica]AHC15244.1 hypothetical protein L21SP2_1871 [Salinispira pacifica]